MQIPREVGESEPLELTGYLMPASPSPIFIAYHVDLPPLAIGEETPVAITPIEGDEAFAHGIYRVVAMDSHGYELEYRRPWLMNGEDA